MNGQELINITKRHLDDAPDDDTLLDLLNIVVAMVEGDRNWEMLKKEDSSQTFGSSESYLTAKNLPVDFLSDIKVKLGVQTNDDYLEYDPCRFEERRKFATSRKYCIDLANKKFYICDKVGTTYTIYLYYIYETDPITLSNSPVWPVKFQRIIPLLMAEIYKSGIDADVWNISQALALSKPGMLLYQAMERWDDRLKNRAMAGRAGIRGADDGDRRLGYVNDPDNLLRK